MKSLTAQLEDILIPAIQKVLGGSEAVDPLLREAADPKFGDYQCNVAMSLAKRLKKAPRDVAAEIVAELEGRNEFSKVEIAGPGFINLTLSDEFLISCTGAILKDEHLGVEKAAEPKLHVVDFSGPNLAKEMHIGHLRTTITGEVICRILEFMGHPVDRVNHVGDWGTQFGMLIEYIFRHHPEVIDKPESFQVSDLEDFYKKAKKEFDDAPGFADDARSKVVALQAGDETVRKLWQVFLKESLRHCHELYEELGVTITDRGESFYNDRLPGVIGAFKEAGLAKEDQGALCVFSEQYKNRDGDPLPMIIQKKDGGFNYASTDLAGLQHRILELGGKRLIYITDIRQAQHFSMVFEAVRQIGWAGNDVSLEHIGYGMILNKERKPFKTRDGNNVSLKDVVKESVERAGKVLEASRQEFSAEEKADVAKKVGLAAIKYGDLSHNLASDYVFDWDQMLAMEGNTGPYMLYAYARIQSIGRKAEVDLSGFKTAAADLQFSHPSERNLAKAILKFPDVIHHISQDLKPHTLTDYLYNLSKVFHNFYDRKLGVSVLGAETPELQQSRLAFCALTAEILRTGLNLLSIDVVERM